MLEFKVAVIPPENETDAQVNVTIYQAQNGLVEIVFDFFYDNRPQQTRQKFVAKNDGPNFFERTAKEDIALGIALPDETMFKDFAKVDGLGAGFANMAKTIDVCLALLKPVAKAK